MIISIIAYILTPKASKDLTLIIITCITIQALTLFVTIPGTSLLGFLAFNRGLNPDVMIYPLSSTVADIWATISFLIALALGFKPRFLGRSLLYGIGTSFFLFTVGVTYFSRKEEHLWNTLKSTLITVVVVTLISSLAGLALIQIKEDLAKIPGVLIIYPALIATLGYAAAIFGSISTTRLVLGEIKPKLGGIWEQKQVFGQIFLATLIFFTLFGCVGVLIGGSVTSFFLPILCFFICFPIICLITFSLAILTFTKGLDPDEFVIPIETTLTDALLTSVIAILLTCLL